MSIDSFSFCSHLRQQRRLGRRKAIEKFLRRTRLSGVWQSPCAARHVSADASFGSSSGANPGRRFSDDAIFVPLAANAPALEAGPQRAAGTRTHFRPPFSVVMRQTAPRSSPMTMPSPRPKKNAVVEAFLSSSLTATSMSPRRRCLMMGNGTVAILRT